MALNICLTCNTPIKPSPNGKYCNENCYRNSPVGLRCSVEGCAKRGVIRGMCQAHYKHARRRGEPLPPKKRPGYRPKPFVYARTPTDLEKAYIAGYFDGEGCLRLKAGKRRNWYARISFNQTQSASLRLITDIYGGGLRPYSSPLENERRQVRWELGSLGAVEQFLKDVRSFVREKRTQVDAVLTRFFDGNRRDAIAMEALNRDLRTMKREQDWSPTDHAPAPRRSPITFRGKTMSLKAWAARMGMNPQALGYRLRRGWPLERALTEPVRRL